MTTPLVTHRGSVLASAVAVYLGGYLLINGLNSQLPTAIAGFGAGPEYIPLFGGQLLFAVVVCLVGVFLAPAPASRKLIASVVVLVATVVTLVAETVRLTGNVGGIPMSLTLANPYFMSVLALGAAWLIVRGARLGWLSLLASLILIPVPFLFTLGGVPLFVALPVVLLLAGVIGLGILAAGRARA